MEEKAEAIELRGMIVSDLHLEKENDFLQVSDMDLLKERLVDVINHLLQHDYAQLINAMYRLDIDEKLFREAISGMHSPNVASRLADLVIRRELEKIQSRKKYKS